MNALSEIKNRFSAALSDLVSDPTELLGMIRPAGDPKFGDYQANCSMPLGKKLGKAPREIATDLVAKVALDDLCQSVEIAGPGFINLTLDDDWIKARLTNALTDDRLGVPPVTAPRTVVVDYSSPNIAKPLHVGHIRSTFIGDAISKVLRFVGHNAISDNHLGDWGTQFGMIIYGYKHFVDQASYEAAAVKELGRLYKHVRKLMDYHSAVAKLPESQAKLAELKTQLAEMEALPPTGDKKADKAQQKQAKQMAGKVAGMVWAIAETEVKLAEVDQTPELKAQADAHPEINQAVLLETAALHAGDEANTTLWKEFLPSCRLDIQRMYDRLSITFDHEHGESFYHSELANVVNDLEAKGFTRKSDGATCVFLDNHDAPMIVQKRDGAFLYATTDLATIKYRMEHWQADACLYVVDHRQSEHFEKLFDVAKLWGYADVELTHVAFGTVMGPDGTPYKTRSGDTVGLEGLLDEAEKRALEISKSQNSELPEERHQEIATVIGIGGLKYADLSHNRGSDYVFNYDKMLALRGNTATYLQYGYARVQGILRKTEADVEAIRANPTPFEFENEVERQLGLKLIRFGEALDEMLVEYKPNILCNYLFDLTQTFAQFFDQCSVKDAGSESLKASRLQLCDLTARTIKLGLGLLGIEVLDKM
ncbi:MAG: arginyl-tRNA synthetase [Mariniblastus sp.]|jgi:arginyl-tRNA synthetase